MAATKKWGYETGINGANGIAALRAAKILGRRPTDPAYRSDGETGE